MSAKRTRRAGRAVRRSTSGGWRPPGWIWLLVGIGLGSYGTVMLLLEGGPSLPEIAIPPVVSPEPTAEPDEPELPPSEAPRFDFYSILPRQEIVIPDEEIRPSDERESATQSAPLWIVQVGSFRTFEDADGVRARLALQGIESHISMRDGQSANWHRVRVGPIASRREADRIRSKLQRLNFQPLILKAE